MIGRCPFCGGEEWIICMMKIMNRCSCGAMGEYEQIEEEAIGVWNIVSEKVYAN